MPTPFVTTTFAVLTMLNSAGQLAPVDKALLPAGINGPIQFNAEACAMLRGKMENPEKYVCQIFTSPGEINLTYQAPGFVKDAEKKTELTPEPPKPEPAKESPRSKLGSEAIESKKNGVQVGKLTAPEVKEPEQAPKPKRVAQRPRRDEQAMFEGNPLAMLFNW
jgi:hypothetical protein